MSLLLIPQDNKPDSTDLEIRSIEKRLCRAEAALEEFNKQSKETRQIIIGAAITIISSIIAVLIKLTVNA